MKNSHLDNFIALIDNFSGLAIKNQIDCLAFFAISSDKTHFTAAEIHAFMHELNLRSYPRLSAYLSEESKKKNGKYIKMKKVGYTLERNYKEQVQNKISKNPIKTKISQRLFDLTNRIKNKDEETFHEEALKCYGVNAYRASIIMIWQLTMAHLQSYIFSDSKKLSDFNTEFYKDLARKKINQIKKYDDFSEINEEKFIELMRASNIITNDVRKILIEKLGTRNTVAHPSNITISENKTIEFILDLTENVIIKYS